MRTFFVEATVTTLLVGLLTACGSSTSPTPSPDASSGGGVPMEGDAAAPDPAAPDPATYTVEATNFAYAPAKLTIKVGDTVKWTFAEGTHTITSGKNCAADGKFDSKALASPATYMRTFDSPGTFDYFCDYREHCSKGQVGVIVVQP